MSTKFLEDKIVDQVKDFFQDLVNPVKILFFGSSQENCDYCSDTLLLMEEIAELSEKISIETYDIDKDAEKASQFNIEFAPTTVITTIFNGTEIDYGVRFLGIPAGHEFTSMIVSLVNVSKQESGLSNVVKEKLASLTQPVELKVFVTPTCPYCPNAVILAHQMAIESKMITGEMVEAMEFPDLSEQFKVSGVPHTIINMGMGEIVGAAPESLLMEEIEKALKITA
ncbi:MAG: glutaredoxin [Chloroflexi bacterium HGW-Chloroflexi-8]|jgi:glutaredoxin-like protein|nr:MAG: glutaredoxin [Chloroflexi bacterium HGW-Chloroflexi-8]